MLTQWVSFPGLSVDWKEIVGAALHPHDLTVVIHLEDHELPFRHLELVALDVLEPSDSVGADLTNTSFASGATPPAKSPTLRPAAMLATWVP